MISVKRSKNERQIFFYVHHRTLYLNYTHLKRDDVFVIKNSFMSSGYDRVTFTVP